MSRKHRGNVTDRRSSFEPHTVVGRGPKEVKGWGHRRRDVCRVFFVFVAANQAADCREASRADDSGNREGNEKMKLNIVGASRLALCCVALAMTSTVAQAAMILGDAVPLSQLANDGILIVGDKQFTNFTYTSTNESPEASGVNVIPIQDDDGNYGIRFQAGFVDSLLSPGASDAAVTFDVTALDPKSLITDAHLIGDPFVFGDEGAAGVVETIRPEGTDKFFQMGIIADALSGETILKDWVDFDKGYRTIHVKKDIFVSAEAVTPNALSRPTISIIDQTFSQTTIPEPAALVLLGSLGAAAGVLRYRWG